jgi:Rrf2 family protein
MHVNARVDYAVRAVVELAGSSRQAPRRLHEVADAQAIPLGFLTGIITQLRSAGVVRSQRGADGGYWLARPAAEVDLGCIICAVEGSLLEVRGQPPEEIEYVGSAVALKQVWIAVRNLLERVTVANVVAGELPPGMLDLTRGAKAGEPQMGGEHAATVGGPARSPTARRDGPPAVGGPTGRVSARPTSVATID